MRPLVSVELSNIKDYLPFNRSRRTGSPFTDDLENSSNKPSITKLCSEKPYDGPCYLFCGNQNAGHRSSKHLTIGGDHGPRGEVRTHRSIIESYSPHQFDPLNPTRGKLPITRQLTAMRHISTATHPPISAQIKPPARKNHLSAATHPPPAQRKLAPRKHISACMAPPPTKPGPTRPRYSRQAVRLSQEEMNKRYQMWYQGRGSEVGRGLWNLEIVPSGDRRKGILGSDILWEDGSNKEQRRKTSSIAPPRSRL